MNSWGVDIKQVAIADDFACRTQNLQQSKKIKAKHLEIGPFTRLFPKSLEIQSMIDKANRILERRSVNTTTKYLDGYTTISNYLLAKEGRWMDSTTVKLNRIVKIESRTAYTAFITNIVNRMRYHASLCTSKYNLSPFKNWPCHHY